MPENTQSIAKQVLGAGVGTLVALTAYGVYTFAAPPVKAFLSSVIAEDVVAVEKYTEEDRAERRQDIVERARQIIEDQLAE